MGSPKLKCILIEDEPLATKKIVEYIHMFPNLELVKMVADIENPTLFSHDLKSADILFLDLIVSGGNINTLADFIADIPILIITSAISRWQYPAFIKNREHFALQKPISLQMFQSGIEKALQP
jgi:DNA-binding LytR/AlgR family response regulator